MKRSLKRLTSFDVQEKDGTKGKVKDFLFDEKEWVVRYLEVDLGSLIGEKKVLVPRSLLQTPDWENKLFPVDLTMEQIETCPKPEEKLSISKKYEEELHKHYKTDSLWSYGYITPTRPVSLEYPPRPIETPTEIVSEKEVGTRLRSFNAVEGYHVQATDGKLGIVSDLIVDDTDWQIVYGVVDTSNWKPWSKKVLVPVNNMDEISYIGTEVKINLSAEIIEDAPEYEPNRLKEKNYEKELHDYYSRHKTEKVK